MTRFPSTPSPDATVPGTDPARLPPGAVFRLRRIGPGSDLPSTTAMLRSLDDLERARAARTADAAQCASFVAGRYLLRCLAADLLGIPARPLDSNFSCPACGPDGVPDHGRPAYLLRGERVPLALSLSRAGGFVLLGALGPHGAGREAPTGPGALAPGRSVPPGLGVDLATIAGTDFEGFDDVALTPEERQSVSGLPVEERGAARAGLWARKEALVKALGTGFSDRGPDTVDVLREPRITDLPAVGGTALEPLGLVAAVAVAVSAQERDVARGAGGPGGAGRP